MSASASTHPQKQLQTFTYIDRSDHMHRVYSLVSNINIVILSNNLGEILKFNSYLRYNKVVVVQFSVPFPLMLFSSFLRSPCSQSSSNFSSPSSQVCVYVSKTKRKYQISLQQVLPVEGHWSQHALGKEGKHLPAFLRIVTNSNHYVQ